MSAAINRQKILCVIGTRPEAVKMAPVIKKLSEISDYEVKVCLTGQHREMLDPFIDIFKLKVDMNLDIMVANQSLSEITARVVSGMDKVLSQWQPDYMLIQGDTTTVFGSALAAFYRKIKIGHIEAGLRTYNYLSPFPEEMNRHLTSQLATIHFTPTEHSRQNLLQEKIPEKDIFVTGNTVIDALFDSLDYIESSREKMDSLRNKFSFLNSDKRLVLVTGHRRENFGAGFVNICMAISDLARRGDIQIVYPTHLNPNVREPVYRILHDIPEVYLLEPLDYLSFIYLMKQSYLILTDSGGVQEEAPSLGKPVLVMRDTTERPEVVQAGAALLVGAVCDNIVNHANRLLDNRRLYESMSRIQNPCGDGKASDRIIKALAQYD